MYCHLDKIIFAIRCRIVWSVICFGYVGRLTFRGWLWPMYLLSFEPCTTHWLVFRWVCDGAAAWAPCGRAMVEAPLGAESRDGRRLAFLQGGPLWLGHVGVCTAVRRSLLGFPLAFECCWLFHLVACPPLYAHLSF